MPSVAASVLAGAGFERVNLTAVGAHGVSDEQGLIAKVGTTHNNMLGLRGKVQQQARGLRFPDMIGKLRRQDELP
jgi:hypothetical protein